MIDSPEDEQSFKYSIPRAAAVVKYPILFDGPPTKCNSRLQRTCEGATQLMHVDVEIKTVMDVYLYALYMYLYALYMYLYALYMYLYALYMYLYALYMYLYALYMYLYALYMYLYALYMYLYALYMYLYALYMYTVCHCVVYKLAPYKYGYFGHGDVVKNVDSACLWEVE